MKSKYEALKSRNNSVKAHPSINNSPRLSMDPLKVMPAHCLNLILHNLTGKEVLKAREVSSEWCNFIEREKNLMDHARKSTKILVQSKEKFPDVKTSLELKNLEIVRPAIVDHYNIGESAKTVENLKIKDGSEGLWGFSVLTFSSLCKLEIVIGDPTWLEELSICSFPVLSEYKLIIFQQTHNHETNVHEVFDYETRYDLNSNLLKKMPNLKRYSIHEEDVLYPQYNAPFPFQLEFIFSNHVPTSLINNQAEWIKELDVDYLMTEDLPTIEIMSQLKTLRVGEFFRNVPIEIYYNPDEPEFLVDSVMFLEFGDDDHELIKVLLRGLPSVETFICHTLLKEDNLRFIGTIK